MTCAELVHAGRKQALLKLENEIKKIQQAGGTANYEEQIVEMMSGELQDAKAYRESMPESGPM